MARDLDLALEFLKRTTIERIELVAEALPMDPLLYRNLAEKDEDP